MRLFVALGLPSPLPEALSSLAGDLVGARWVPARHYHLTLRFIGEVAAPEAEAIDAALSALRAPAFPLALAGTGHFSRPGGGRASLWAGTDRNPALAHLQAKVDSALHRAGLAAERRRFQPHVTLARLDGVTEAAIAAWMQARNLFRTESVLIDRFTLFSSRPGKDEALYTPEVDYALA